MGLLRFLRERRNYRRWVQQEREEREIERLNTVIGQRQTELHALLRQINPTSIEARYPPDVRLVDFWGISGVAAQRERVRILDERISAARRKIIREGGTPGEANT